LDIREVSFHTLIVQTICCVLDALLSYPHSTSSSSG
jgi:hypothetical protein